jgi:hypothetical protein
MAAVSAETGRCPVGRLCRSLRFLGTPQHCTGNSQERLNWEFPSTFVALCKPGSYARRVGMCRMALRRHIPLGGDLCLDTFSSHSNFFVGLGCTTSSVSNLSLIIRHSTDTFLRASLVFDPAAFAVTLIGFSHKSLYTRHVAQFPCHRRFVMVRFSAADRSCLETYTREASAARLQTFSEA